MEEMELASVRVCAHYKRPSGYENVKLTYDLNLHGAFRKTIVNDDQVVRTGAGTHEVYHTVYCVTDDLARRYYLGRQKFMTFYAHVEVDDDILWDSTRGTPTATTNIAQGAFQVKLLGRSVQKDQGATGVKGRPVTIKIVYYSSLMFLTGCGLLLQGISDMRCQAGGDAGRACFDKGHYLFQFVDPAGGFYTAIATGNGFFHELDVVYRCTGQSVACRGLDEFGARFHRDLAGRDLFVPREQGCLDDRLDRPALRCFDNGANIVTHDIVELVFEGTHENHHVDFVCAVLDGILSFEDFARRGVGPKGKACWCHDHDRGVLQDAIRQGNILGMDASDDKPVYDRLLTEFDDFLPGSFRLENGRFEIARQFFLGQLHRLSFPSCCCCQ